MGAIIAVEVVHEIEPNLWKNENMETILVFGKFGQERVFPCKH